MITLKVEIDGYFRRTLITGRKCSKEELKQKYLQAIELASHVRDVPEIFCRLHNFEQLHFEFDLQVDYVIDTDTDKIYNRFIDLVRIVSSNNQGAVCRGSCSLDYWV